MPSVLPDVQPFDGASMMAYSTNARPTIDSTAPTGSSFGADGSFDVGMRKTPAIRPITTIGTFTRNTEPQ